MKDIVLFLKGIIIGIGKIIPGVSGAMLAITLGVYEKGLNIISNLKTEFKKNIRFIFVIGTGIMLAIIFGSKTIKYFLDNYYLYTMMLFIGMILGGMKSILSEVKGKKIKLSYIFITLIVILIIFAISFINVDNSSSVTLSFNSFILLFFSGILDATATVIPGVCGTALLMIIGYYNTIISALGSVFDFNILINNLFILVPFALGLIVGIYITSKIINYCFKNFKTKTYYGIIGFAISSIVILFGKTFELDYSTNQILISILFFAVGYIISYILDCKGNKE